MNHKLKAVLRLGVTALIMLLSAACGKQGDTQATISDGADKGDVVLVTLKDGTRCAVLIGLKKGAISCDWK